MKSILYIIFILCLFACNNTKNKNEKNVNNNKYAKCFSITNKNHYKILKVLNPWNNFKIHKTYYLFNDTSNINKNDFKDGIIIKTPIQNIAPLSSTHLGFLKILNVQNRICGVLNANYVYDSEISQRYKNKEIESLGEAMSIDVEKIINLKPQLIMVNGMERADRNVKRVMEAGIKVAFNNEWMESTPLARTEWIKFIAAFFNKDKEANQYFDKIEKEYLNLTKLALKTNTSPKIMAGLDFNGTWYIPGGKSYYAGFLKDANSNYPWSNTQKKGSHSFGFESVINKGKDADFWFISKNVQNLNDFAKIDEKYTEFDAFKNGNIYTCMKRVKSNGANDWWESSIANPHLVLKDIIKILHPEILPKYNLYFYRKLN